jgi:hypothetical protein
MNPAILFTALPAVAANAQLAIVPARTVEQPRAEEQTVEHPVVLANFRLRLEYRLPTAGARLAVRVHPSATVALPVGKAGAWRVLDLQYEQLVGKAAALVAEVAGTVVAEVPAIAQSKNAQLTEQVTFPRRHRRRADAPRADGQRRRSDPRRLGAAAERHRACGDHSALERSGSRISSATCGAMSVHRRCHSSSV